MTPALLALRGVLLATALAAAVPASVPAQPARPAGPEAPVDMVLILDTSGSMSGADGAPVIFPQVQSAARQLVEQLQPGDNLVLITYDSDTYPSPAVRILDREDLRRIGQQIGRLSARGRDTWTAKAVRDAFAEVARLDSLQRAAGEAPHAKLVLLFTDGRNDPPDAVAGQAIDLNAVARRVSGMPVFAWQIQLGDSLDRDLDRALSGALGGRYGRIHDPSAPNLVRRVREEIIRRALDEARRRAPATFSVEPAELSFGTLRRGRSDTLAVRVAASVPHGAAWVAFESGADEGPLSIRVEPESLAFVAGGDSATEVRVIATAARKARAGLDSGRVVLRAGPVARVAPGSLAWRGSVEVPPARWPLPVAVAVAIALLVWLAARSRPRPLVGRLEAFRDGAPLAVFDLENPKVTSLVVGGSAGSGRTVEALGARGFTLRLERVEGEWLCVARAAPGTTLALDGEHDRLALHDGDEFLVGDVHFEYRGPVSRRPARAPEAGA